MIYPGDIVCAQDDVRLAVYDGVAKYYLLNMDGMQAGPDLFSLQQLNDYCEQRHESNLSKDYPGRIYRKIGTMRDVFPRKDSSYQVIPVYEKIIARYGNDKVAHFHAALSLVLLGGEGGKTDFEKATLGFVDALHVGLRKELLDRGRSPELFKFCIDVIRDQIKEIFSGIAEYNLDTPDLRFDLAGAAVGLSKALLAQQNYEQAKEHLSTL